MAAAIKETQIRKTGQMSEGKNPRPLWVCVICEERPAVKNKVMSRHVCGGKTRRANGMGREEFKCLDCERQKKACTFSNQHMDIHLERVHKRDFDIKEARRN